MFRKRTNGLQSRQDCPAVIGEELPQLYPALSEGDLYVNFRYTAQAGIHRVTHTQWQLDQTLSTRTLPHEPFLTPTDISPLPVSRPPDTLQSTQPTQRRQMTAHTGNAIRDLPLRPDPHDPHDLRMSHCASYDSATTMSQMSHHSATKHLDAATSSAPSQLRRGHTCNCMPATKRHHAATQLWHATHPQIQKYKNRAANGTVVWPPALWPPALWWKGVMQRSPPKRQGVGWACLGGYHVP